MGCTSSVPKKQKGTAATQNGTAENASNSTSNEAAKSFQDSTSIMSMTDSYKITHWMLYKPDVSYITSYLESRGGPNHLCDNVVVFGFQYLVLKYLSGRQVTPAKREAARKFWEQHFGTDSYFNEFGTILNSENKVVSCLEHARTCNPNMSTAQITHLLETSDDFTLEKKVMGGWYDVERTFNGYLPLDIDALPEGTVTSSGTPLLIVKNSHPQFPWVTNFVETIILQAWYPVTVASNSFACRTVINQALLDSGFQPELIDEIAPIMLHDFGFRGVSSVETAGLGGAAHLLSFKGTDTAAGIHIAQHFYGAPHAGLVGMSVAATEHSVMTSFGGRYCEHEAVAAALKAEPKGIISVVSDSYNVWRTSSLLFGGLFKSNVTGRTWDPVNGTFGRVVVRPDSGDPATTVVCLLKLMSKRFEDKCTKSPTGLICLPPQLRILQGDGIDFKSMTLVISAILEAGFSADNVVFGSGGALLQKFNRDTLKFAIKASMTENSSGEIVELRKAPIGDAGKASKAHSLVKELFASFGGQSVMRTSLSLDGSVHQELKTSDFSQIRARVNGVQLASRRGKQWLGECKDQAAARVDRAQQESERLPIFCCASERAAWVSAVGSNAASLAEGQTVGLDIVKKLTEFGVAGIDGADLSYIKDVCAAVLQPDIDPFGKVTVGKDDKELADFPGLNRDEFTSMLQQDVKIARNVMDELTN